MTGLTIFTANITGVYLLEYLDSFNFYPDIVTYEPGSRKTSLYRDLSRFSNKFNIIKIESNKYDHAKEHLMLDGKLSICIDWTKDFFKGYEEKLNIIFAHPARLPMYKGYSAVTEQFLRGVVKGGVSFYKAGAVVDGGDVLDIRDLEITFDDYPEDFFKKYAQLSAEFIMDIKDKGESFFKAVPQDSEAGFYLVRKRQREGHSDFGRDAYSLYNHIRGFSKPFFGAFSYAGDKKMTIWKATTEKWQGLYGRSGEIIDKGLFGIEVACGTGSVVINEVEICGEIFKGEAIPLEIGYVLN